MHATGFIGGAWSKETAIKMAEASLEEHKELERQEQLRKEEEAKKETEQ